MTMQHWRISHMGGIESDSKLLMLGEEHHDHLEMGGRAVNAIIQWKTAKGQKMSVERWVRWPTIRLAQDDTYGAFKFTFASSLDSCPMIDGKEFAPSEANRFWIDGFFSWEETDGNMVIRRTIFPSTSLPCLLERWEIRNTDSHSHSVNIPDEGTDISQPRELFQWTAHTVRSEWIGSGKHILAPGESMTAGMVFSCREENAPSVYPDLEAEWNGRLAYRNALYTNLELITADPVIDHLFQFSKLRAAENVAATRGGLMHSPGGFGGYLAALWCNDQNEYVSPFFPFLGDPAGNQSAFNAYQWFARYQNDAFRPIPSSIVAEGRDVWEGAGDRGDAAMTAYGASRWALANGDEKQARALWPFVRWCLEYCERQKDDQGVIRSDSDELENRFSSGKTNLATSCLAYDALVSASHLARSLGEAPEISRDYAKKAEELRHAIECQFGATVEGYATYRYHENLDWLRAWICIPLAVGITERASGTVEALFSPKLWTDDGLVTEEGTSTRWDRSTLYALRSVFMAGKPDEALARLSIYANRRLLGEHVPYCIEAYPEANQSHLSAESGLFCRIFTEGVCGIRPTGLQEFECTPFLPEAWPEISLRSIHAFAHKWSLHLIRQPQGIEVKVTLADGHMIYHAVKPQGETHHISLGV